MCPVPVTTLPGVILYAMSPPSTFDPCEELLPTIVDHYAAVHPDKVYAEYPLSPTSYADGYRKITYRDLANAVNGIARWLNGQLGPGTGEKLTYFGPNDLRYPALAIGAVKAGYCMFFTSPRNSIAAHASLLKRLNCKTLISPNPRPAPITAIVEAVDGVQVLEVASVDELLGEVFPHFPFEKTLATAAAEPLFVIHTSGSTGIPNPIIWTNEAGARAMRMAKLKPPEGSESLHLIQEGKRLFMMFPPFHGAGLASHLVNAIPFGTVLIHLTPAGIPNAASLVEGLKKSPADGAFIIPSIIHELSQTPDLLDYCANNLEMIMYAGGDLPQAIGDVVAKRIKVYNQYGATEVGLLPMVVSNRDVEDWGYSEFHPEQGVEFWPVTGREHELVLVRHPNYERHQVPFVHEDFKHLQEYNTRDLYVRHPDEKKRHLWRWHARKDDIVVFLNGEKTNPISVEQYVTARNKRVTGALVAGAQRFQAALIVEAATDGKVLTPTERAALLEEIWPSIEETNQEAPAHARISKSHVLFTHPDKPFLRAGKGTVQRAGSLALYEEELDALYREAETVAVQPNGEAVHGPGRNADREAVKQFVSETIVSLMRWTDLKDEDNIFIRGMDSLQTITAVRILRHGLEMAAISVPLIYMKPSVSDLTDAIMQLKEDEPVAAQATKDSRLRERSEMLKYFQDQIDQIPKTTPAIRSIDKHSVILTGSTGVLGTYLLDTLLNNPSVAHIYCLNRRKDSRSAQLESNKTYHLGTTLDFTRITFLTGDLSKEQFDLPAETYQTLRDTATVVIHNAWPVNFNLSLSSFTPQLQGIVNLLSFCADAASPPPRLFFMSSISSVMDHQTESGIIPEASVVTDTPAPNGYAESKYLSEQLLAHAARKLSLPLSFARVGQIAGAARMPGLWNKAEWFPSLALSSRHIGAIPDAFGPSMNRIDWVPVDLLSEVLVGLALSESDAPGSVEVFHPHNLHPQSWLSILPAVQKALSSGRDKELEVISLGEWIVRVRRDMEEKGRAQDQELERLLRSNPAVKLLDFYEGLDAQNREQSLQATVFETSRTAGRSEALRAVPAIDKAWIAKWIGEWVDASE
ncbi:NRPS-like enzyme [Penicillium lagena]|uniref:NRPS-like enzyme n=1 Tax=Penicillium lagena TaxID=94218 RepID=UPI002541AB73|nr:NRPS-like enzyme [Penicillium lagena]KAJ5613188.1 NRPS-like enzyme [Penicillium lagena]